jgi:ABC-type transport system involved in cytochrome c biogenesis permease subunit
MKIVGNPAIFWLRIAACLYAVGLLHSMLVLLRKRGGMYLTARATFRIAAILHGVAIVDLGMAVGRIPVENFYQTLSLCAFLIAVLFLAVESKYQFASTAVALFPLVFLMVLVSALEGPVVPFASVEVRGAWLAAHIVLVIAGYASLLLTSIAAVAYLIQERRLKSKKGGRLLEKLPPLATLDNLISGSLGVAFVLITLGMVLVITWEFMYEGGSPERYAWIGNPRVYVSLVTWALLLATTYLRATAGWRGRKAAVMSLVVLGCSAITWAAHTGFMIR